MVLWNKRFSKLDHDRNIFLWHYRTRVVSFCQKYLWSTLILLILLQGMILSTKNHMNTLKIYVTLELKLIVFIYACLIGILSVWYRLNPCKKYEMHFSRMFTYALYIFCIRNGRFHFVINDGIFILLFDKIY